MRRAPQFSILSVLLAMAFVALVILLIRGTLTTRQLQREVANANQKIQAAEEAERRKQAAAEGEFAGLHGDPVLSVDPRLSEHRPLLGKILNSKYQGQSSTLRFGPPDKTVRQVRFDLRLLRTLDKKDYYRLSYSIDSGDRNQQQGSLSQPQNVVLFEYDGKPKLLVSSDSLVMAIAPDRQTCIETTLSVYRPEEADKLRERWLNGPYKLVIEPLFIPAGRSFNSEGN